MTSPLLKMLFSKSPENLVMSILDMRTGSFQAESKGGSWCNFRPSLATTSSAG
jgi:hypothetical protein